MAHGGLRTRGLQDWRRRGRSFGVALGAGGRRKRRCKPTSSDRSPPRSADSDWRRSWRAPRRRNRPRPTPTPTSGSRISTARNRSTGCGSTTTRRRRRSRPIPPTRDSIATRWRCSTRPRAFPKSPSAATTSTTSGKIASTRAGCTGARRWRSFAATRRRGKRCSISMRWRRKKESRGRLAARSGWRRTTAAASSGSRPAEATRWNCASSTRRKKSLCRADSWCRRRSRGSRGATRTACTWRRISGPAR